MTNSSSSKKKSKNKVHATTSKDPKTLQKRGRKVAPPIVRPTLPNLSVMLPNYLHDSGFFDKTGRTDWASMEAYKDKETGEFDCGMYVATFAEYLSDEINIPSISFWSDYLHNRYATLLWKYGMDKFKTGYVSDNDDPTRPKSFYTIPAEGGLINIE
ncbi:hypothetical protein H5410_013001 [Solanum commersonii]|uniref:Ulp1 protease family, C-terminal catalytic domain containing protein n=1 Tax=Solanum commersonii TaxID=4109 RepID=A0A9J6AUF7_SOLCO|nr:hypothetical protein H5410_013001 [Solanum commersonii]